MKMKKMTALLLAALLLATLSACQRVQAAGNPGEDGVRRLVVATGSPEDTVTHLFAQKFAEEIEALGGGAMTCTVFGNSTLGGDVELLEASRNGDVPFVVQTTAPQIDFIPDAAIFDLPCAFFTIGEFREAVADEAFRDQINESYAGSGYYLLGLADQGFRVMTSNKAVHSLPDLNGQKIRTMENKYHIRFWSLMGANPTPMNFGEVYIGLQQSTIDAQENPCEPIVSAKLYEQQDYLIETNHLPHVLTLLTSKDFYDGLTPAEQSVIDAAADTAEAYAYEQTDQRMAQRLEVIAESGTEIIPASRELFDAMREKSGPIYDDIRAQVGDALVDSLLN